MGRKGFLLILLILKRSFPCGLIPDAGTEWRLLKEMWGKKIIDKGLFLLEIVMPCDLKTF